MSTMLQIGASALHSTNRAMATASHNVANVATEGFSRQRVEFNSAGSNMVGSVAVGRGVEAGHPQRIYDQYVTEQLRNIGSEKAYLEVIATQGEQLDGIFGTADSGLQAALESFYNAASDVSNDPTSAAARAVFVEQSDLLTMRFNTVEDQLQGVERVAQGQISKTVAEINKITESLVDVNGMIKVARQGDGSARADLLDQRDKLLSDLSDKMNINAYENEDQTVNVYLKQGQSVVMGVRRSVFEESIDRETGQQSVDIMFNNARHTIGDVITRGELGGLLEGANEMITQTRNTLGRTAMGLGDAMNTMHRQGIDLSGNAGQDLFSFAGPDVKGAGDNAGTAAVTAVIDDFSQLTAEDYAMTYNAASSDWTIKNTTTDATVTAAGPSISLDGFTLTTSGAPADGDIFYVRPSRDGIVSFASEISNGSELAAASKIRADSSNVNAGDGNIEVVKITDGNNVSLTDPVTIQFDDPPSTFSVLDSSGGVIAAAQAYTPEATIAFNGWEVKIENTPASGDTFEVIPNNNGSGDNMVMRQIAALRDTELFVNGTQSATDAYTSLVGSIGTQANIASINLEAKEVAYTSLQDRRDSISGVNLDEEAADLIRLQQAYMAASRVISTSQRMFDSLIQML